MTQFSGVCNVTHALCCLQYWQPMVGNIGTFGTDGRISGANVETLNGIDISMLALAEPQTHPLLTYT